MASNDNGLSGETFDEIFRKALATVNDPEFRKIQQFKMFSDHASPDYKQGMFINTKCPRSEIHDYDGMHDLLRKLAADYPNDAKIESAGKSQGFGSKDNALDIWTLNISSTQPAERTAFFVGGHHPEFSGPETVYLIAKNLLESYHKGNENVKKFRESNHLVFIPQVHVDLYKNLDMARTTSKTEFSKVGYSYMCEYPEHIELNRYIEFRRLEHFIDRRVPWRSLEQTRNVKNYCNSIIELYGKPLLAIDYHEGPGQFVQFTILQSNRATELEDLRYVYAEVSKKHATIDREKLPDLEEYIGKGSTWFLHHTFTDFMFNRGCQLSYTFEAPEARIFPDSVGFDDIQDDISENIEMNLIATERILARYICKL